MDPLTHGLASYALKRAAFPRFPRSVTIAMLVAGTIADLDTLSLYFGPSAYLTFYRTFCHSLLAAFLISILVALLLPRKSVSPDKPTPPFAFFASRRVGFLISRLVALPFLLRKSVSPDNLTSPIPILTAALSAAVLHVLLDLCQSTGVELFWPFSPRRFALDWVAHLDLWILGVLLAGILLPALSGLVTEEIGAKSKGPRGRFGATFSLAAVILYIGVRSVLHGNALAAMESRTYRGESSRRVAAFAESTSPFRWHGIVETERALLDLEVEVGPTARFDPDSAIASYKPEASPALDAARNSAVARRFLQAARFPKASVEKTPNGFHVILRDLPYTRGGSSGRRVEALIDTDPSGKILSEELAWSPTSKDFWWK